MKSTEAQVVRTSQPPRHERVRHQLPDAVPVDRNVRQPGALPIIFRHGASRVTNRRLQHRLRLDAHCRLHRRTRIAAGELAKLPLFVLSD
jgi:hypothetical protein